MNNQIAAYNLLKTMSFEEVVIMIMKDNLPVIKDGKERFFLKSNVEKWLENKNNQAMFRSI